VLRSAFKDEKQREGIILSVLKDAEIIDKKDKYPLQLSGGMRQRLSVARAFVYPSEILLMDEPFRSLDIALKRRMTEVFLRLWQKDKKNGGVRNARY
jgi:NitT/TauT family transport system ATP-binding protein